MPSRHQLVRTRKLSVAKFKSELVNITLVGLVIAVLPTLASSLLRIPDIGFQPIMLLHIVITTMIFVFFFLRKRLTFNTRATFIVSIFFLIGIGGILKFGLSGNAIPFLLASIIFASILYNKRVGMMVSFAALLTMLIYLVLVQVNIIKFTIDFNQYNQALSSWIAFVIAFGFLALVLVITLGRFNQFFFDLVYNLENHVESSTKELKLANKAKSEFLANMSHEIRTPMNGVLGLLRLLAKTSLNEDQRHKMNLAKSSAESLLSLINDILDFSKIEAGKMELDAIEFNLTALLGEIAEANAIKIQDKAVELVLDTTGVNETLVKGDPNKIRQIITNLLGNAIKFTHQGQIILKAELASDGEILAFICSIEDTGIGIESSKVNSLFDAFTQADSSTTREYGGTGLGLSICAMLCKLMNGDIKVSSQVDKGSVFEFNIELQQSLHSSPIKSDIAIENLTILVVDNNVKSLMAISRQLHLWGAKVVLATSVMQAIETFEKRIKDGLPYFDGALIDYDMPEKNGLELVTFFKQQQASIPTLIMTELHHINHAEEFISRGVTGYFPKPATTSDLNKSLHIIADSETWQNLQQKLDDDPHASLIVHENEDDLDPQKLLSIQKMNARVLIVEDNFVNQEVVQGILEEFKIKVDIAENGLQALQQLSSQQNNRYALIFMDCQMPELDGYQTTRAIRNGKAGESLKDIVIIAMTANALEGDKKKCLDAGMDDYLPKPVEPIWLLEKLYQYLCAPSQNSTTTLHTKEEQSSTSSNQSANTQTEIVWDKQAALKRLRGKQELLTMLTTSFTQDFSNHVKDIKVAAEAGKLDTVQLTAHTLKGSAGNIGALKIQSISAAIENALKQSESIDLQAYIEQLKLAGNELTQEVNSNSNSNSN